MLFSVLPNEKKREKFSTDLGVASSQFRHGILLSALYAQQTNAFEIFYNEREKQTATIAGIHCESNSANVPATCAGTEIFGSKVIQPKWLKPGYITQDHCEMAAVKAENRVVGGGMGNGGNDPLKDTESLDSSQVSEDRRKKQSTTAPAQLKGKKRDTQLTRADIACEAAGLVYKLITNLLYRGRDAGKLQIFHDLLYVFTGWSQYATNISQGSLKLKWQERSSKSVEFMNNVPQMGELKLLDRLDASCLHSEDIHTGNMNKLSTVLKQHPEMALLVQHDVNVGGKVNKFRHYINIIEVVTKLVTAFCTLETNAEKNDIRNILSVNATSLKLIVVISIALRELVDRTMKDVRTDGSVMWENYVTGKKLPLRPTDYVFPSVNGVSLDVFQPARSRQKDDLCQMILTMREDDFNARNIPLRRTAEDDAGMLEAQGSEGRKGLMETDGNNDGNSIRLDESLSVFAL